MKCQNGHENPDFALFCEECGARIAAKPQAQDAPTTAQAAPQESADTKKSTPQQQRVVVGLVAALAVVIAAAVIGVSANTSSNREPGSDSGTSTVTSSDGTGEIGGDPDSLSYKVGYESGVRMAEMNPPDRYAPSARGMEHCKYTQDISVYPPTPDQPNYNLEERIKGCAQGIMDTRNNGLAGTQQ
jgi:hypothetical protein